MNLLKQTKTGAFSKPKWPKTWYWEFPLLCVCLQRQWKSWTSNLKWCWLTKQLAWNMGCVYVGVWEGSLEQNLQPVMNALWIPLVWGRPVLRRQLILVWPDGCGIHFPLWRFACSSTTLLTQHCASMESWGFPHVYKDLTKTINAQKHPL